MFLGQSYTTPPPQYYLFLTEQSHLYLRGLVAELRVDGGIHGVGHLAVEHLLQQFVHGVGLADALLGDRQLLAHAFLHAQHEHVATVLHDVSIVAASGHSGGSAAGGRGGEGLWSKKDEIDEDDVHFYSA